MSLRPGVLPFRPRNNHLFFIPLIHLGLLPGETSGVTTVTEGIAKAMSKAGSKFEVAPIQ